MLTSFHVYDCAVGWLKDRNVNWFNHGTRELKGFESEISIHESYDPLTTHPQREEGILFMAEEAIVFDDKPMTIREDILYSSRDRPSFSKPIRLDEVGFNKLIDAIVKSPPTIQPLKLTESADPYASYIDELTKLISVFTKVLPSSPRMLWVDDFPKNNHRELGLLIDVGLVVDLAISTEEALKLVAKEKYLFLISDMGRGDDPVAGLTLLRSMRGGGRLLPTWIYASPGAAAHFADDAIALGAILCTGGQLTLLDGINQVCKDIYERVPRTSD